MISISLPSSVGSVVSSVVVESDSTVVIEPVFDRWKGWFACNVGIPVFVNVDFQSVDNAPCWFSLIVHFASENSVGDCAVSCDGAVWIGVEWGVVKLRWPGSVGSVIGAVVDQVDWTVVVKPEGYSSKACGSFCENVPLLSDLWLKIVGDTIGSVALWSHFAWSDSVIKGIGLIAWTSFQNIFLIAWLNLVSDLKQLILQHETHCQGKKQAY